MAKSYYEYTTDKGSQMWGRWVCVHEDIRHNIIEFCRSALDNSYADYDIEPIYFDDKYFQDTKDFFSEVGVKLHKGEYTICMVIKGKIHVNIFNNTCRKEVKSIKIVDKL